MTGRRTPSDNDLQNKSILTFLLFWNLVGFFIALGALWVGLGFEFLGSMLLALCLVTAADAILFVFFRGAMGSVDGFLGMNRPVDQVELSFLSKRDIAEAMVRRHEFAEAAMLFRELVADPKNQASEKSAWRLADLYAHQLGRPADAVHWYRKSMSIIRAKDPEGFQTHPIWNELERGVALFANVRATDDADFQDRAGEIVRLIEENMLDEARAASADMLRRYPTRPDAEFWAAIIDAHQNNFAMAAERYRRVLIADERHLRAMFNLASALRKLDHLPEAKEIWTKYLNIARDNPAEGEFVAEAERELAEISAELKSALDVSF